MTINHNSEEIVSSLISNQDKISKQQETIAKLIELQNKLIEKLIIK